MQKVATELKQLLETVPGRLAQIAEPEKSPDEGWSYKEILGHLIDSAANNHLRLVRGQLEDEFHMPGYEQEEWVKIQGWHERPWLELIILWESYNRHLLHLIEHFNLPALSHRYFLSLDSSVTMEEVIIDYIRHLKTHLADMI